ncbi:efflux RND transporter periplasmic adaptor subunit [Leucothrix mucor]|uniref:efflux RND transporter periplasmic adaptor subunit n=1 Tax=Leucothrix mucor TaxID=45248 RepID=UPI0003B329DF|nr:HlyD family efflux transporter periplasmic adaptor subunit [Leucothrix mucor]
MSSATENPTKKKSKRWIGMLMLPLIIVAAVMLVRSMMQSKPPLEHEVKQFPERLAHVITVEEIPFRAHAVGYGSVEPSVVLKYKAEVAGKVTYVHPSLKQGGSIAAGTEVIRIEPTTYEISLGQSKAGLANTQSSLKQLEAEEKSAKNSLEIAKRNLALGQQEYNRVRSLWDKRLIARSTLDAEQQKVLQLSASVETIQGNLDTFKSRRAAVQAQIQQSKSSVAGSTDTLARTTVSLPFDARIGEVLAEEGAFVSAGTQLFEALGTQAVEIDAQLSVRSVGQLMGAFVKDLGAAPAVSQMESALSKLALEAKVHQVADSLPVSWNAKLVRVGESVDSTRDTVSFTVRVENPYEGVMPGKRPPLLKGLYVAVEFKAPPINYIVIPREAVHEGRAYVVGADNKLEIRPVTPMMTQGNLVVIADGLSVGDQVIISDLVPVIEGLPLKPIELPEELESLRKEALGEVAL